LFVGLGRTPPPADHLHILPLPLAQAFAALRQDCATRRLRGPHQPSAPDRDGLHCVEWRNGASIALFSALRRPLFSCAIC
jgi:hypothetical protein